MVFGLAVLTACSQVSEDSVGSGGGDRDGGSPAAGGATGRSDGGGGVAASAGAGASTDAATPPADSSPIPSMDAAPVDAGATDAPTVVCRGPEDCVPPSFCNFADNLCGEGEATGICRSVFDQASPEANVCSCDGVVYGHRFTTYGQANLDISAHADCEPDPGTFRCPAMPWAHCFDGTYCERSYWFGGHPDAIEDVQLDCTPMPPGCNECGCLTGTHCPGEITCVGTPETGFSVLCKDASANLNDAGLDCPLGGTGCNAVVGTVAGTRLDVRDSCYQVGAANQDAVLSSAPLSSCTRGTASPELVVRVLTSGTGFNSAYFSPAPTAQPIVSTGGTVSLDVFDLTQRMKGTFDLSFGSDRVCGCFDVEP